MLPISTQEAVTRIIIAFILSGLIGLEREYHRRPAGLRTNIVVGLGSTLMTISSIQAAGLFVNFPVNPTSIAAQIVTGVGFLGAGAILHKESSAVVGLTTAATLWVVAGLGIAVGLGLYAEAIATAALTLFTFLVVSKLVVLVRKKGPSSGEHQEG